MMWSQVIFGKTEQPTSSAVEFIDFKQINQFLNMPQGSSPVDISRNPTLVLTVTSNSFFHLERPIPYYGMETLDDESWQSGKEQAQGADLITQCSSSESDNEHHYYQEW